MTDNPTAAARRDDPTDPFAVLQVIDRLEVGPVRVEEARLVAPYRVVQGRAAASFDLIYRFEEAVFDPQEEASCNLAAMLAAQIALNYGLFCREIAFHGTFDALDRRFLRGMAENTAREIYVNKFLAPNPFLEGPAARLPSMPRSKYLLARLVFPGRRGAARDAAWQPWTTDPQRYAVLSSGGKDSLLTYGLMREVTAAATGTPAEQTAVHPVFVNESGRHWFTALNAYRHFNAQVPQTARVWVNSDRLFAWMLRRLPFIRKDFAAVRADEYPIRLWTVAVFLFGALPLLRKRGIGRLLVGDEYDTTRRRVHEGIRHYDGLYDQSLYFDQALSAYFLQKGWMISQFSILRPLSELLIEKILALRYPALQALQTSCHAASKGPEGVVPCGRCEKCRRIVGMLTAIGVDARRCGYTTAQIDACLKQVVARGVHQEGPEAAQLVYLLHQGGHIPLPPEAAPQTAKPAPEVMHLRFDRERAPFQAIPVELREPLWRIWLTYAEGALIRQGRQWVPIDLLTHPERGQPFPHDVVPHAAAVASHPAADPAPSSHLWGELTWPDAEDVLQQVDVALLPVGAIEQHGPHLPLDTDAFDAEYLARRVAEACPPPRPLVLPLLPYGVSYHHNDFKGTLSVNNATLANMVYDIGMSAAANGVHKLVIINGHGGNAPSLNYAAQMINRDARIFVCVDSGETSDVDIAAVCATPNDVHAGEIETSTSLATRPHLVRQERLGREVPDFSSHYLDFTSKRGVSWYAYTHKISASGVMGDPTQASGEKGRRIWSVMVAHLVALVEDLKQLTLDEIHHRGY